MAYLEVNNKASARRIEKQIEQIELEIQRKLEEEKRNAEAKKKIK